MLDEPDSGVDVENLEIVGKAINKLIKGKSGLLITHLGYILRYVRADRAHVMIEGRMACFGNPMEILDNILKSGYKGCERCQMLEREPNVH
jgi:Fe-S cluster assembly ATP-binding protein